MRKTAPDELRIEYLTQEHGFSRKQAERAVAPAAPYPLFPVPMTLPKSTNLSTGALPSVKVEAGKAQTECSSTSASPKPSNVCVKDDSSDAADSTTSNSPLDLRQHSHKATSCPKPSAVLENGSASSTAYFPISRAPTDPGGHSQKAASSSKPPKVPGKDESSRAADFTGPGALLGYRGPSHGFRVKGEADDLHEPSLGPMRRRGMLYRPNHYLSWDIPSAYDSSSLASNPWALKPPPARTYSIHEDRTGFTPPTRSLFAREKGAHQQTPPEFVGRLPSMLREDVKHYYTADKVSLGNEWDVVGKDEAGEEDWLAVEVDDMTAKMKFSKVAAENL